MAPPPSPDPEVLMDELVEEFLLRLPPDDPEVLARAALVSRQWYRVVTGPSFRRRFRELYHSTPPLLGYVLSLADCIHFVPLSSFRPPRTHLRFVRAVSSSHGLVLLHRFARPVKDVDVHLSVWDPITDEQQDLPVVPLRPTRYMDMYWDAAVVCTIGDGCDHLRCHFTVVFVGNYQGRNSSCFYSSEAGSWSDPVFAAEEYCEDTFYPGECIPIGTSLYTTCGDENRIFKYDLQTHQMCNVSTTPAPGLGRLIAAQDGRLGIADQSNNTLRMWLRENGRWEESRAIDLHTLLPADALGSPPFILGPQVVAFADTGAGVIFLWTSVWFFTIDLKSGSCKKIEEVACKKIQEVALGRVVPYVSFCTPAPAAGVVISSDEVPVADIAVSTDEGPGAGVTVYADVGPGAAAPAAGVVISSEVVPVADIAVSSDEGPGAGVAVS